MSDLSRNHIVGFSMRWLICCRDSLRRHFKNRDIHRFVSISNIPDAIKDFILLKTVLPTLKYTDMKQSNEWNKKVTLEADKSTPEAQVMRRVNRASEQTPMKRNWKTKCVIS